MTPRRSVLVVAALASLFTLLVSGTSAIRFAYRSESLQVAVETAAALISLFAALLIYGRFRQSLQLRDLVLTASLAVFAVANLAFSAVPTIADVESGGFRTWAPVFARLLGAGLMAGAAFLPDRPVHHAVRDIRRWFGGCALALASLALVVLVVEKHLPQAIDPALSPESSERPRIVGHPVILVLQLVVMLLFAAAAVGFTRRLEHANDALTAWLAVAATLAAFSRLNYFLFPSLYSEWFYAGDVLRLAFFLVLLVGGALELRRTQRDLATAAVLDERRRIAREIHDGVTQDLAYIVQQGRRLAEQPVSRPAAWALVTAAERALEDSRHAISALARPGDEPLLAALTRAAEEVAGRGGATVVIGRAVNVDVPHSMREALTRVVREAVSNAVNHGGASHVVLEVSEHPELRVRVADDGCGFIPAADEGELGRFGLVSMRERVSALGGQLHIRSRVGEGSEVVVMLP